jgi:hypothetical protein
MAAGGHFERRLEGRMAGEIPMSPARAGKPAGSKVVAAPSLAPQRELPFATLLTAAFAAILFPLILHHAMWRDELQVWQLVRARPGIGQLLASVRFEGHPILWFLLVDAIAKLTSDPVAMKLLHATIAGGTVFIVAWQAPWKRWLRAAFALGYFPLFEYGVITRNYNVGIFLGFLACALLVSPGKLRLLLLSLVLLLMTECDVFAAILAIALAWGALIEWLARRDAGRDELPPSHMIIALAVMLVGFLVLAVELRPDPQAKMYPYWYEAIRLLRIESTTASLAHSFLPVPDRFVHFWGANFLDRSALLGAAVALVLGTVAVMISARRPASLVIVVLAFAGILSFMYIKVAPWGLRHQGHLFFAFLFADWISRRGAAWPPRWRHLADRISSRRADWFLGGLLVVQAGAGLFAAMRDVQMPFSAGRETAQFIQQNYPPDVPIVGDMDAAASTVAGYLDRSIYYVAGHREGTFIVWDKKRYADEVDPDGGKTWADPNEVFAQAQRIAAERSSDVVIVFSQILDKYMFPVPDRAPPLGPNIKHVWRSHDAIEGDEVFDLYVVSKPTTQPSR